MTLYFKLKRLNPDGPRKFKRSILKNWDVTNKGIKSTEYKKWYTTMDWKPIIKFLNANINKSVDKVYSEFLKRWKSPKYNPMDEFDTVIKNCNFKVVDGVIKRKEIANYDDSSYRNACNKNKSRWEKINLYELIKRLSETKVPQRLGNFFVPINHKMIEKTIYIDYFNSLSYDIQRSTPNKNRNWKIEIDGVGYGIDCEFIETQTGKTKRYYSVANDPFTNPLIYFYYKNKVN